MTKISSSEITQIIPVLAKIKEAIITCPTMEEAAQTVVDILYAEYNESIVLARMFATIAYKDLPPKNQAFVSHLAEANGIGGLLGSDTPVMSLIGTHGLKHQWNNRRDSQGHVGIPLVSETFIDKIPMMSRLLKEVGLSLTWLDSKNTNMVIETAGRTSGIFFVEDASSAVDQQNRKIIAAQDFVAENQVKTVFGLAGGYATSNIYVTLIVFCREKLARSQAALFSSLITGFKANTTHVMKQGHIFRN